MSEYKGELKWEVQTATASDEQLVGELLGAAGLESPMAVQSILHHYPHLEGLSLSPDHNLETLVGVGPARERLVQAALAFASRALHQQTVPHGQIYSSEQLGEILVDRFAGIRQEQMLVFFLDIKNQILCEEMVSSGTIEASMTDQRVILRRALVLGASRFVICHNHPSGDVHPSSQDEDVTERIRMSGQMMGIELVDHVVVGGDDYLSFREEGLL
ncbi:JAB domain-containing protein [Lacticaseibacillus songhuajiangensis]|jgi:DNA repair protein RadC|uniref:JAB domain-containing protein n=1 Tax=Lacticaseibacillus songhuajiangensis TaxID=1296539 RepID=UPI000F798929|nr:DNA repair protein RadC [Lacticaseibacillus songhuajiangensis]